jgi:hypothetical protein
LEIFKLKEHFLTTDLKTLRLLSVEALSTRIISNFELGQSEIETRIDSRQAGRYLAPLRLGMTMEKLGLGVEAGWRKDFINSMLGEGIIL